MILNPHRYFLEYTMLEIAPRSRTEKELTFEQFDYLTNVIGQFILRPSDFQHREHASSTSFESFVRDSVRFHALPNPVHSGSRRSILSVIDLAYLKFPRFIVDTISEWFPPWQRRDRRAHAGAPESSGMHHRQRRSENQGAPWGESLILDNYDSLKMT